MLLAVEVEVRYTTDTHKIDHNKSTMLELFLTVLTRVISADRRDTVHRSSYSENISIADRCRIRLSDGEYVEIEPVCVLRELIESLVICMLR